MSKDGRTESATAGDTHEVGFRAFLFWLALAVLATLPAMWLKVSNSSLGPSVDAALFGAAILAAGFMLSWGAESAEGQISSGLIVAALALVTVLPEYAVDIYYALRAGQDPSSNYIHYAAANMTGANRLLIGLGWPLLVMLAWWRTRARAIPLAVVNWTEVAFLLLPTLYAFVILLRNRIGIVDAVVLIGIYAIYVRRVTGHPKSADEDDDDGDEEEEEPGLAAAIERLPVGQQYALMAALTIVAALVIYFSAERFAEAIIATGHAIGMNEFLLIQWVAPLASEAPTVTVAVLFVLSLRPSSGLAMLISDKINQWTLLVGMLPLAMSVGAGSLTALPLDARQHEEFFLTAAQSLFAIALLLRLRLGVAGALALFVLFTLQVTLAFAFRENEPATIATLTSVGWGYIVLTAAISLFNLEQIRQMIRAGLLGRAESPIPPRA
jgi:cation:H+ antiporter